MSALSLDKRIEKYKTFINEFGESNILTSYFSPLKFVKALTRFNYTCTTQDGKLDNKITLKRLKNSDSKHSDVNFGSYTLNKKDIQLAIKKIPLDETDLYYLKGEINPKTINESESDILTEIYFLKLTSVLFLEKVTNFLPILYKYYICNDCNFNNKRIVKKFSYLSEIPCLYVITEKADGEFEYFVKKRAKTYKEILSAYLQIYTGLYVLKKYFNVEHQDLHISNVLYFNVKPGGYWKYKIGKKTIYIPCYGNLFILWDLGFAIIPEKVYTEANNNIYMNETKQYKLEDQYRIIGGLGQTNKQFIPIEKVLKKIIKSSKTPRQVVMKVYNLLISIDPLPEKIDVLETYNTNKKLKSTFGS